MRKLRHPVSALWLPCVTRSGAKKSNIGRFWSLLPSNRVKSKRALLAKRFKRPLKMASRFDDAAHDKIWTKLPGQRFCRVCDFGEWVIKDSTIENAPVPIAIITPNHGSGAALGSVL